MPIACPQCASDDLERVGGDAASGELTIRCLTCGATFTREPRPVCARCGSTDVVSRTYEGWAYDDVEAAREKPQDATWAYYDREEFRCQKCNFTWRRSGKPRPYEPPNPPGEAAESDAP